jgi:KamA family protein
MGMKKMKVFSGSVGFEEFCTAIGMMDDERALRRKCLNDSNMSFLVNEYYADLLKKTDEPQKQQLLNIVLPPVGEKKFEGRFDPYGNKKFRQADTTYLQHKYKQTLLVHINNACLSHCQFCYKVNELNTAESHPYRKIVTDAIAYIKTHPQINNILLTGGDPMVFSNEYLSYILEHFSDLPQIRGIRIATKTLSFYPLRFLDDELLSIFTNCNKKKKHISIIAQISHPAEFSYTMVQAIEKIQQTGGSIRSQPVLARGINDRVETLTTLFQKTFDNKIVPYYLVHFMPVRGVEQYALPIDQAYKIAAKVNEELSGLEKKSIFIAPHDFGKFEVCGFYPSTEQPDEIVLKWHQIVNDAYLPKAFMDMIPTKNSPLLKLKYKKDSLYNMDDVFEYNQIPTN